MSALCRFCCRSPLQAYLVSDSVAVMRFATEAGRIRFQLTLAHDAALVRLIEALYLIFKLAVARRQSLDHYIRLVRHVQVNRVRGKQPLAELESVLRHNTDTLKWVN